MKKLLISLMTLFSLNGFSQQEHIYDCNIKISFQENATLIEERASTKVTVGEPAQVSIEKLKLNFEIQINPTSLWIFESNYSASLEMRSSENDSEADFIAATVSKSSPAFNINTHLSGKRISLFCRDENQ